MKKLDIDGPHSGMQGNVGPYLQLLGQNQAIVEWNFAIPSKSKITMAENNKLIEKILGSPSTHYVAGFCGLKAETRYIYQVDDKPPTTFSTLPDKKQTSFRFAVIGDYGWKGENLPKVIQQMEKFDPQWMITTGDNAYDHGTYQELKAYVFTAFAKLLATRAFYPTLGNHDVKDQHGKAYLDLFTLPVNSIEHSERYYSFDAADIHFSMLDSASTDALRLIDSPQINWLKKDLKGTTQLWKIVVFHHSPYSNELFHHGDRKIQQTLIPILADLKVDLVFTGHSHTYERTYPLKGVVYIVTGGGGKSIRLVWRLPWSRTFAMGKKRFHFVGVRGEGFTLSLEAIDHEGNIFDRYDLTK